MRRLTASSNSRSDMVSSIEPDFYSMSKISPLPEVGTGAQAGSIPPGANPQVKLLGNNAAEGKDLSVKNNPNAEEGTNKAPTPSINPGGVLDATRNALLLQKLNPNDKQKTGLEGLENHTHPSLNAVNGNGGLSADMLNEMQLRGGIGGPVAASQAGPGDPSLDGGNPNDFSQLDSVTRHQLLQAQYLNSMNMRNDSLQQQILAQQSLLTSLQGHHPSTLSQLGGGIGVGVSGMGMGMGIPSGAQMPSLMGAGAPMGSSPFPINGNQGSLLGNSNQNGMNPGSNLQFY